MTVTAPPLDTAGKLLDAEIATLVALVAATPAGSPRMANYQQQLNAAQVAAVNHYMVTGWLNAGSNVLATYAAPGWDKVGQGITASVAAFQGLYNTALVTPMPAGNANGYGDSGWTTIAAAYHQALYAKQMELVQHLMDLPGGTSAATILANLTGVQTDPGGVPYQYVFNSVGFTDAWIDD